MNRFTSLQIKSVMLLVLEVLLYVGYFVSPRYGACDPGVVVEWFVSGPCGMGAVLNQIFGLDVTAQFIIYLVAALLVALLVFKGDKLPALLSKKLWR